MPKMIRSARGEMVNFDLVLIKQEIAANAAPTNVSNREDFIEGRIRRRARRTGKVAAKPSERELGEEVSIAALDLPDDSEFEQEAEEIEEAVEAETTTARPVKK